MHLTAEVLMPPNSYSSRPLVKLYSSMRPSVPPITTCSKPKTTSSSCFVPRLAQCCCVLRLVQVVAAESTALNCTLFR